MCGHACLERCRTFSCELCELEVQICSRCDRGQRYCSATCAAEARRASIRRAGSKFQRTEPGRQGNARRQREHYWRMRRGSVAATTNAASDCLGVAATSSHSPAHVTSTRVERAGGAEAAQEQKTRRGDAQPMQRAGGPPEEIRDVVLTAANGGNLTHQGSAPSARSVTIFSTSNHTTAGHLEVEERSSAGSSHEKRSGECGGRARENAPILRCHFCGRACLRGK